MWGDIDDVMDMCDDCQVNPAIVHLTHVEDGEAQTFHLCEDCARERGIPFPDGDTLMRGLEALAQAAGASLGKTHVKLTVKPAKEVREAERKKEKEKESEVEANVVCPNCGLKLSVFREIGKLGCAECYSAFDEHIERILVQVHDSRTHKGKVYGKVDALRGGNRDVERLRKDLAVAIKNEEFELAATIRDAIHGRRQKQVAK